MTGPERAAPLKIEGLIPHRPPMLAVGELIFSAGDEAVSRAVIGPDSPFLGPDGQAEEALLFEMMAQTFAALAALGETGDRAAGFLAAVRKMVFYDRPEVGAPVEVAVKVLSRVDDFAVVQGRAAQTGRLLAEGQVTIFIRPAAKGVSYVANI